MAVDLKIDLEEVEGKIVLRLEGRLDASSAPMLQKQIDSLLQEEISHLFLDFQRIDYLSSAGLRVLLSSSKKLRSKQGDLILFSLEEEASDVVKMAGFDKVLHICSNEKDALQFPK